MNILNGITIENLLEGELFKFNEDYCSKVKKALGIELKDLTHMVDRETKDFVNEIIDSIANKIRKDSIREHFLNIVKSNLFGSICIFWGSYPKENTLLGELIEYALRLSMASNKACQIDDIYIFEKSYVYLKNTENPFIVAKINNDNLFIVNSENHEQLNISYIDFENLIDIDNTKKNFIASYIFNGETESINFIREELAQYVEYLASKILNEKIKNEFIDDCLVEFRIRCPYARVHNKNIRDIGFVISEMMNKYHIKSGYIEVKGRYFYVGTEVVMKDMEQQFDTVVSYIDENKVIVSDRFNKLYNVSEYTIDKFKESVSLLSDYGIDSSILNVNYRSEYFPMVLAEDIFRISDNNKDSLNIVKNYHIYQADILRFLQYRVRNIKDEGAAALFIKNITEIASGTNAGHKGIWGSQSLLEIINYEWKCSYISKPSICMFGKYYYEGNRIYLKEYIKSELEIERISDDGILIEHPYSVDRYRRVFKNAEELEASCLSEEDLNEIEDKLSKLDDILDNDKELRNIVIRLNQIQHSYKFGDDMCNRAAKLYTNLNKQTLNHYACEFINMSNEEFKRYVAKHMINTGMVVEEKDKEKDIVNKFLKTYNGKMEICRALWNPVVEVAMDKKVVACSIKGKEDYIIFNIKDFTTLLKEEALKYQNQNKLEKLSSDIKESKIEESIIKDVDTNTNNIDIAEVAEIFNESVEEKVLIEELVDRLVEDIFYDNECEFIKLKSIKQVSMMIDANFKIRSSVEIDEKDIPFQINNKTFVFTVSNHETINISFECIAEELIRYKNNSMEQIDLFSMLS